MKAVLPLSDQSAKASYTAKGSHENQANTQGQNYTLFSQKLHNIVHRLLLSFHTQVGFTPSEAFSALQDTHPCCISACLCSWWFMFRFLRPSSDNEQLGGNRARDYYYRDYYYRSSTT